MGLKSCGLMVSGKPGVSTDFGMLFIVLIDVMNEFYRILTIGWGRSGVLTARKRKSAKNSVTESLKKALIHSKVSMERGNWLFSNSPFCGLNQSWPPFLRRGTNKEFPVHYHKD